MFQSELAIMLYVENIDDALKFWQAIGFVGQK
jgi:lactoylglutathione lyase